jgi:hypothetical protein
LIGRSCVRVALKRCRIGCRPAQAGQRIDRLSSNGAANRAGRGVTGLEVTDGIRRGHHEAKVSGCTGDALGAIEPSEHGTLLGVVALQDLALLGVGTDLRVELQQRYLNEDQSDQRDGQNADQSAPNEESCQ